MAKETLLKTVSRFPELIKAKASSSMARLSLRVWLGAGSSWAFGTPTPPWETSWVRSSQAFTSLPRGECPSSFRDWSSPPLGSSASSSWLKVSENPKVLVQKFIKLQMFCELFNLIIQDLQESCSSAEWFFDGFRSDYLLQCQLTALVWNLWRLPRYKVVFKFSVLL